jgi:hypothetical protein
MQAPEQVELSISGILNDRPFRAEGSVSVNNATGVKTGEFRFHPPPLWMGEGPDPLCKMTTRCFVGARWVGPKPSVGPLDLLGKKFYSLRVTVEGGYGSLSAAETARIVGRTLYSEIVEVGRLKRPAVKSVGPLRELITVGRDGTLVGHGSYSLLSGRRRDIPVRYLHLYRPTRPDMRRFRAYRNTAYLLRAKFEMDKLGARVRYTSQSTIHQVPPHKSRTQ